MVSAIDVNEGDWESRVVAASHEVPVVVDFWAGWCQPCLVLGPALERLAEEYAGRLLLAKLDVDANPSLASRFGIQGIPAVKAFREGRVVSEFVGVQPETVLRRFLDDLVPSEADDLVVAARADEERGAVEAAEATYRKALDLQQDHEAAAVGLARLLTESGRPDEARTLLARVPGAEEGRAVAARLDLLDVAAAPGGVGDVARAAAAGEHRLALERALELVDDGEDRDRARELMVRVFEVLGEDHPLTREYRPRLARALF
jgi:putative thioredoxin